jgi:hypothetical protein
LAEAAAPALACGVLVVLPALLAAVVPPPAGCAAELTEPTVAPVSVAGFVLTVRPVLDSAEFDFQLDPPPHAHNSAVASTALYASVDRGRRLGAAE